MRPRGKYILTVGGEKRLRAGLKRAGLMRKDLVLGVKGFKYKADTLNDLFRHRLVTQDLMMGLLEFCANAGIDFQVGRDIVVFDVDRKLLTEDGVVKIKGMMKSLGWTQGDLGVNMNLHQSHVSKLLRMEKTLTDHIFFKLQRAFGEVGIFLNIEEITKEQPLECFEFQEDTGYDMVYDYIDKDYILSRLNNEERLLVDLRRDGKSYNEIAKIVGAGRSWGKTRERWRQKVEHVIFKMEDVMNGICT